MERNLTYSSMYHKKKLSTDIKEVMTREDVKYSLSSAHPQQMYEVTPSDVLCGRGKCYSNHAGNRDFRITIGSHLDSYIAAEYRFRKAKIVENIIVTIRNEFGGKFLKKVKDIPRGWIDIGDEEAQRKVSHALRDAHAERIKNFDGTTASPVKQLLYKKTVTCITPPLLCSESFNRKSASRASPHTAHTQLSPITNKRKKKKENSTALVKQPAKVRRKVAGNQLQQSTVRKVPFCNDFSSVLIVDTAPSWHHEHVIPFTSHGEKNHSCNPMHRETKSGGGCGGCGVEIDNITPLLPIFSESCNISESIETMSCSDENTVASSVACPEVYPPFMDHVIASTKTIPVFDIDDVYFSDDEDDYLPHLYNEEV